MSDNEIGTGVRAIIAVGHLHGAPDCQLSALNEILEREVASRPEVAKEVFTARDFQYLNEYVNICDEFLDGNIQLGVDPDDEYANEDESDNGDEDEFEDESDPKPKPTAYERLAALNEQYPEGTINPKTRKTAICGSQLAVEDGWVASTC